MAAKQTITLRVQVGMLRLAEAAPRILGVLHCDFHLFFHFLISAVVRYLFCFDAAFVREVPCAMRRIQFRDRSPFSFLTRLWNLEGVRGESEEEKCLFSFLLVLDLEPPRPLRE